MNRAYSLITITKADDGDRTISGLATTPSVDRQGDVVEPLGAMLKLPLPLLLDHNHTSAVGSVVEAEPTKGGIRFRAKIAKVTTPGPVKELVDGAWDMIRAGLRTAVSIGFRPIKSEFMDNGGMRFLQWEWHELSLVAVPANRDCTIAEVKALDARLRAANPRPVRVVRLSDPVRTIGRDQSTALVERTAGAIARAHPVVRLDQPVSHALLKWAEQPPAPAPDGISRDFHLSTEALVQVAQTTDECLHQLHERISALETR
ncbi:HK97 family phage prohead protease [Sphingomonas baiyangensis]|uniref:Prohead serine protease domain-containing protein n=1 Tax=Sphingomonas baiyangensis TaxID=2572576 RepID=A0A4U1L735_9SPHN|nr:HK97 family phage prohead protease [Sphingomonas baiyangensis]TKD52056.1 hypothetical protein FBR43_15935 [Sphingomonas baiyangensis]